MRRKKNESRISRLSKSSAFKVYFLMAATLLVSLTSISPAAAAAHPHGTKVGCFSGPGGICDQTGKKSFFLDTSTPGSYAGVNVSSKSVAGGVISGVTFSFNYVCSAGGTTVCATGGSPEYGFPIDTNGDSVTDHYAFVDASNCGETGTVDNSCPVYDNGSVFYANWAAFVLANPTYKIASSEPAFILAEDTPFVGTISNIRLTRST